MTFKRQGSPKLIEVIQYDVKNETDLKCPNCETVIGKQSQGIKRIASMKIIGMLKIKCPKCEKEIQL